MKEQRSKIYLKVFEGVLVGTFLLAGLFLYWQEKLNHNLNYEKSWVNFYFKNLERPTEGVELNNHLGYSETFTLCLIRDNNDLLEPKDLSCNLGATLNQEKVSVAAAERYSWQWPDPTEKGKYWVVLQYITKEGQENKRSLSFVK